MKYTYSEFKCTLLRMKDQFIKFPLTRQKITEKVDVFEEMYGIPQIVGAIEINAPPQNYEGYYNRKQHYRVTLNGIYYI